jgi:hypothetical protein
MSSFTFQPSTTQITDEPEKEGIHVIVYRYRNAQDMEIDLRFSFNPLAGMDFEIDFEEAGMLMYSGPYDEVDFDLWESMMDSIEDGEDEVAKMIDGVREGEVRSETR